MKRYVIDTNVLISFVTDRSPEQQQQIAPLFEAAARLQGVILCHQYALTEFIYVMDKVYHLPKDEIGRMITDLLQMPGIEVIHDIDFPTILSYWTSTFADFGDAVIASVGLLKKGTVIVTFGRKFAAGLKAIGLAHYPNEEEMGVRS